MLFISAVFILLFCLFFCENSVTLILSEVLVLFACLLLMEQIVVPFHFKQKPTVFCKLISCYRTSVSNYYFHVSRIMLCYILIVVSIYCPTDYILMFLIFVFIICETLHLVLTVFFINLSLQ